LVLDFVGVMITWRTISIKRLFGSQTVLS
jgi:hypothetical protein